MRFISATVVLATLSATASSAAIGEGRLENRQGMPGMMPASTYMHCTNWNPRGEEGYENNCGEEGTWLFCQNGRLCVNLEGGDATEDKLKQYAKDASCSCPEDCTTQGDGKCMD